VAVLIYFSIQVATISLGTVCFFGGLNFKFIYSFYINMHCLISKLATVPSHDGSNNVHALLHRVSRCDFKRQPFDSLLCRVEIHR